MGKKQFVCLGCCLGESSLQKDSCWAPNGDYSWPDDPTRQTTDTPGFKPFTKKNNI